MRNDFSREIPNYADEGGMYVHNTCIKATIIMKWKVNWIK